MIDMLLTVNVVLLPGSESSARSRWFQRRADSQRATLHLNRDTCDNGTRACSTKNFGRVTVRISPNNPVFR